jgi:hypothetical protein
MSLVLLLWFATTVLPKNAILVKGAAPSASDASTPVPEQGSIAAGRYRNAYFGLTYPIPAGWIEQPAGPPPSDSGVYVLTQFALFDPKEPQRVKANVLVTAHDLFFSVLRASDAKEVAAITRREVPQRYEIDAGPDEVTIAGRRFYRLSYKAPASGLRWRILSTDARCHALTFTFTGTDPAVLDAAEKGLSAISFSGTAPLCIDGYASGDNVVEKTSPSFAQRYNTIPVRVIVDAEGRVKHIHLLSAFPEQSEAILAALRTWRFKPYRVDGKAVEIETGIVFGLPRMAVK